MTGHVGENEAEVDDEAVSHELSQQQTGSVDYHIDLPGVQVAQIGDHNELNIHVRPAREPVAFPYRTGSFPPLADGYLPRSEMAKLMAITADGRAAVLCQVLSGLGGVGKTQLAVAFAQQIWERREVDLLMWVTASSRPSIEEAYAEALFDITGRDDWDTARAARRFVQWLADTPRSWLVMLDDLTRPNDLDGLWPPGRKGRSSIITTRRRDHSIVSKGELVEVGVFTEYEAQSYLTAKLRLRPELADDLPGLAMDLGYLPLALAQAVTFMLDRRITAGDYRRRFADTRIRLRELVPERGSLPDEYRITLAATWLISVEIADQELSPTGVSRPLLSLASVLDSGGIPESLFTTEAACAFLTANRTTADGPVSAIQARDGLRCLQRLSLVGIETDGTVDSVRIHRLVQRATQDMQAPGAESDAVVRAAADALLQAWPDIDSDRALAQRLRSNAAAVAAVNSGALLNSETGCHEVLLRAGRSLVATGLVADGAGYFRLLSERTIALLGSEHPSTLTVRASYASARGRAGDPAGAAAELRDVLVHRLERLGPDHPDTLATRARLAFWRGRSGDWTGAITALEQLLSDQSRVLDQDDEEILSTRASLASYRGRAGDRVGAAEAFEALLKDRLRINGADYRDTLNTRASAITFRYADSPAEAVPAFEKLVEDHGRVLGERHPDTLAVRASLASYRGRAGDPLAAAEAFEALLRDRMELLGPDHPDTLATRARLYSWRRNAGYRTDTVAAMRELLADQQRILDADHPDTLGSRARLLSWRKKDREPESRALMEELLADQVRILGRDHPDALSTRAHLAAWRGRSGDAHGAAEAYDALVEDRKRVLGRDHPDTLSAWRRLAFWRGRAEEYRHAARAAGIVYAAERKMLGPDDPRTLRTLAQLLRHQQDAEDHAGVVATLKQFVQSQQRTLGPDHRDTLAARSRMATASGRAGDAAGAVKGLEDALADQQAVLGNEDSDTHATRYHLAAWRRTAGDYSRALKELEALLSEQTQLFGLDHPTTVKSRETLATWRAKGPVRRKRSFRPASPLNAQLPQEKGAAPEDGSTVGALAGLKAVLVEYGSGNALARAIALLEALALAGRRVVPRENGIWAIMANALAEREMAIGDEAIDELLSKTELYIEANETPDYTGYRLTHARYARYVLERAARQRRVDLATSIAAQQRSVAEALLAQRTVGPYVRRHLAWHVGQGDCWAELARCPDVLDQLAPDTVTEAMLRTRFGVRKLPSDVLTVGRLRPLLESLPLKERAAVRRIATARRTDYQPETDDLLDGIWFARWARLSYEPLSVTLSSWRTPGTRIRANPEAMVALATVPVTAKRLLLSAGNRAGIVRLWDPRNGQPIGQAIDVGSPVLSLSAFPDSNRGALLAITSDEGVQIWDPLTRQPAAAPVPGLVGVRATATIRMPNDETLLAIGTVDGVVQLWEPLSGKRIGESMIGHDGAVLGVAVLRGKGVPCHLATVGIDGTLRIWDARNQEQSGSPILGHEGAVYAVASVEALHNCPLVVTGGQDKTVRLWNPVENRPVGPVIYGHRFPVRAVAAVVMANSQGKKSVVATGGDDGCVLLWDVLTAEPLGGPLVGHVGPVLAIATVPSPTSIQENRVLLATGSGGGSVRLWDVANVRNRPMLPERVEMNVSALAATELDAGQLMVATGYADGAVQLRDQSAKDICARFAAHASRVSAMAVVTLLDGEPRIVSAGDDQILKFSDSAGGTVRRFDGIGEATWRLVAPIPAVDGGAVVVSVDSRGTICVWNPENGTRLITYPSGHVGEVTSIAGVRLPNGAVVLATGGYDRTIRLRDLLTGKEFGAPLTGDGSVVHALTVLNTPQGQLLVSEGRETGNGIALWDLANRQNVANLTMVDGDGQATTLTPIRAADGQELLAAVVNDGVIRLWSPRTRLMVHRLEIEGPITACAAAGHWLAIGTERGVALMELRWSGH